MAKEISVTVPCGTLRQVTFKYDTATRRRWTLWWPSRPDRDLDERETCQMEAGKERLSALIAEATHDEKNRRVPKER